jgi:DNA-directed RNA polymerase subunit K/omega
MRLNKKNEITVRASRLFSKSMINAFIIKNIKKMHNYVLDRKQNFIVDINKYLTLNDKRYNIVYQISKRNKYIQKEDTFYIDITNEKNKIKVIKQIYSDHMNLILTSYKEEIRDCFSTLKIKQTPILHK